MEKGRRKMKIVREKAPKMTEDFLFSFFSFLITFRKPLNFLEFFRGSTKLEISTRKKLKSHRAKSGKVTLAPLKKFSCYTLVVC